MFYFGCDYYPEQWRQWLAEGEAAWERDAELMAEAGFNVARLAEFAWGALEPAAGEFDFGWLDRAVAALQRREISVVLCTPTAAPPPWLLAAHPDITQVTAEGRRQGPGTRREACANHPVYRQRSRIICEALAAHYAGHPAVIGWQTDNEFGCHGAVGCCCDHCAAAFRSWLRARYGTVEALNEAWGSAFWGELYAGWEQVPPPTRSTAERSPSHLLDYQRFSSDVWRGYQDEQLVILRRHFPQRFITHNLMGFYPGLNYYDLARDLDFVSWDNYDYYGATPAVVAAAHDHMWGVKRRNFWVMEQQVGQINWSVYNPAPPPGFVRRKSYQAIAHGADGLLYFRWRQAVAGAEQYHSGLLDQAGRPTMGYYEAQAIGRELKTLAPLLEGTEPRPQVAILLDYDSRWSLQLQPHNARLRYDVAPDYTLESPALRIDYDAQEHADRYLTGNGYPAWPFLAPYVALWERSVATALVEPESDLSAYRLVCAPFLNLLRPEVVEKLARYVEGGGTLVLGPRTGVKDAGNKFFTTPQPGPLAALAGVTVRLFDSLEPAAANVLRWAHMPSAHRTEVGLWAEVLEAQDAEVVATYTHGWYAGEAAITSRRTQAGGRVVYVGCMGGPVLYETLFNWLLPQVQAHPLVMPMRGVEAQERIAPDGRRLVFLINHTRTAQRLSLARPVTELLSGERCERAVALQPGQVAVYEDVAARQPIYPLPV